MIIWESCLASWRLTILPSWYMNRFSVSTILSQTCCHCQEKHVPVGFQGRSANVMQPHTLFNLVFLQGTLKCILNIYLSLGIFILIQHTCCRHMELSITTLYCRLTFGTALMTFLSLFILQT